MTNNNEHDNLKVTPIPSPVERDPLLEELNVLKLEGRYFCFDRTALKDRVGSLRYRDGNRGLVIQVSEHGHPSILAYRVLQAIFRKVTLEGKPFPEVVSFSYRELSRLVGRAVFGGKDAKELYRAISQLEDTKITLVLHDQGGKAHRTFSFRMLVSAGFIGEGDIENPSRITAAMVRLHPIIIDSMRREHFAIFDWRTIESLEPLTAAFYKRVYYHFSNLYEEQYDRRSLHFEKDYADICGEWLGGLLPRRAKSQITRKLGEHFAALKRTGLIRSVAIERMADGQSWKLVFRPGEGFFRDYALFYVGRRAPVLQFQQAADQFHIQAPIEGVAYFYARVNGATAPVAATKRNIFPKRDTDYAKKLIEELGNDSYRALVDYAVAEARKTNFNMKSILALNIYLPHWQVTVEERERAVARRRDEQRVEREEKLRRDYESFRRHQLFEQFSRLSTEEQTEIRETAERRYAEGPKGSELMRERMVEIFQYRIVEERYPIPPFEEWRKSHG